MLVCWGGCDEYYVFSTIKLFNFSTLNFQL
jgi:hypothetical protein